MIMYRSKVLGKGKASGSLILRRRWAAAPRTAAARRTACAPRGPTPCSIWHGQGSKQWLSLLSCLLPVPSFWGLLTTFNSWKLRRANRSENWLLKYISTDLGLWQCWLPLSALDRSLQSQRSDIQKQSWFWGSPFCIYKSPHREYLFRACLNNRCLANAHTAIGDLLATENTEK